MYQFNPIYDVISESVGKYIVTPGQLKKIEKRAKEISDSEGYKEYSPRLYRNKKEKEYFKRARKEIKGW